MGILNRHVLIAAALLSIGADADESLGIVGGIDYGSGGKAYAAFISSSGVPTVIPLPGSGAINSVGMNSSGQAIIGGNIPSLTAYAALASFSTGTATPISLGFSTGNITSVAINSSGVGIVGGQDTSGSQPAYSALVSSGGTATQIALSLSTGIIRSVGINNFAQAIVGGQDLSGAQPAYAAFVSAAGMATPITLGLTMGTVRSVAINSSGQGIIGGRDLSGMQPAYAALVSAAGIVSPITLGLTSGNIRGVAINDSGAGIVGGQDLSGAQPAYAALVSPAGMATSLSLGITTGFIAGVAINSAGQAIIGGQGFGGNAYAALVSSSGILTPLPIGIPGIIEGIAINDFGQALISGEDFSMAFGPSLTYLVAPDGTLTSVPLLSSGRLFSSSISTILLSSAIPTSFLSGNNLIFANYINKYAPQDVFYFIPSIAAGTLADALESAVPTRNAISLNSVSNNLFFLTTSLANHLRQFLLGERGGREESLISHFNFRANWEDQLLAAHFLEEKCSFIAPRRQSEEKKECFVNKDLNRIWFHAIGSSSYQKQQNQTPSFHPISGGVVAAYERAVDEKILVGGGASYLFTHVREGGNAGHSNINQENLFAYASWQREDNFYIDGALWAGFFQINQVRNIHMTGFDFKASSDSDGWQMLPHFECGWTHSIETENLQILINPFLMLDLANAWQSGYEEKGGGPFNAGQMDHYSSLLRTEAGFSFFEIFFLDSGNLIFQEKGSYVNVQSFRAGQVNAFLVGSPGSFTVQTLTGAQNLGAMLFLMTFEPRDFRYPSSTILYQGEFGTKYQSHQLNLGVDWNF